MKVDLATEADKRSFMSWLVCSLVGDYGVTFPDRESVENANIVLTVNGKELDVVEAVDRLYEAFEQQQTMQAVEVVEHRFDRVSNLLEDLKRQVVAELKDEDSMASTAFDKMIKDIT